MTDFTRANAWNEGGTFDNGDLLWYARGVGKMMERQINDPASWWFFAAIHGEYVNPTTPWYPPGGAFPAWDAIQAPPAVPTTPLPSLRTQERFWNQCQHASWYFLPWHRGYLMALEAQLRADIVALGGPDNWSLPYWDYFGGVDGDGAAIPPAFLARTLPDGGDNPLLVNMRYGPDDNGAIYVPTAAWVDHHPGSAPKSEVLDTCMEETEFTGGPNGMPPGFGGPESGFSHSSGLTAGGLESNPHNLVHVYVGGAKSASDRGLMSDPGLAALDPVFYLHHCNIDRMWALWNAMGNANSDDPDWLNGPAQQFIMPMPGSEPWVYTPRQVQDLSALNYRYQDEGIPLRADTSLFSARLATLGHIDDGAVLRGVRIGGGNGAPAELLGAHDGAVQLGAGGATTVPLTLHAAPQQRMLRNFEFASAIDLPDQVYLKLENVHGEQDATVLRVYVNLPPQADAATRLAHYAGSVGLFGLRRASIDDGEHGGSGLNFVLDISRLADTLFVNDQLSTQNLQVSIEGADGLAPVTPIEVGRVSVYRKQN